MVERERHPLEGEVAAAQAHLGAAAHFRRGLQGIVVRHDRERELGEGQPGGHGRGHQAPSGRTRRAATRGRGARRVPCLRRVLVLDRRRVRHLRRPRDVLRFG